MRARRVFSLLIWPVGLALVASLVAGVYAVRESVVARRTAETKEDEPPPRRAANAVIKLGKEFAESQGIKDEPAVASAPARCWAGWTCGSVPRSGSTS